MKKKKFLSKDLFIKLVALALVVCVLFVVFSLPVFAWSEYPTPATDKRINAIVPRSISYIKGSNSGTTGLNLSIPVPSFFANGNGGYFFINQTPLGSSPSRGYSIQNALVPIRQLESSGTPLLQAISLKYGFSGFNINNSEDWSIQLVFDDFYIPAGVNGDDAIRAIYYEQNSPLPWFVFVANSSSSGLQYTVRKEYDIGLMSGAYPETVVFSHSDYTYTDNMFTTTSAPGFSVSDGNSVGINAVFLSPAGVSNALVKNLIVTISFPHNHPNDGWQFSMADSRLAWNHGSADAMIDPSSYSYNSSNFYTVNKVNYTGFSANTSTGSSFLSDALDSFFAFEIFPGFTLAGVVAALIGLSLLIAFLKFFAGG